MKKPQLHDMYFSLIVLSDRSSRGLFVHTVSAVPEAKLSPGFTTSPGEGD